MVRTLGLAGRCYDRWSDSFHSPAVDPTASAVNGPNRRWLYFRLIATPADRCCWVTESTFLKSGRKMPAVKLLYQESEGQHQAPGHHGPTVQVVSMLVAAAGSFFAVPLAGRNPSGGRMPNRDHRTLP